VTAVADDHSGADDTNCAATHRHISIESVLVLALALALGAWLRFVHLGAAEIEGDEAVSWQAASAPTVAEVVRLHEKTNPGKLPIYSIILHLWINLFGESEAALRGLSAALGTLAIALVWFAVNETLHAPPMRPGKESFDRIDAPAAASLCALIAAASLVMIRYSREARMYPLMLAMLLAQVGFLMRAARRSGFANYTSAAIFTALAIAANFTALLAIVAEGVWLAWAMVRRGVTESSAALWRLGATLVFGVALLAPFAGAIGQLAGGVRAGVLAWMGPPRLLDPIQTFESTSGGWVFALLALLAVWGCVCNWRERRALVVFALLWMWLPPLLLLPGSYAFFPMNAPRYSLSSFIPFYLLASLAMAAVKDLRARYAFAGVLLILMVARVNNYYSKPRDVQYREAVALAMREAPGDAPVGVASWDESFSSTLYYFASSRRRDLIALPSSGALAPGASRVGVLILPDSMRSSDLARYRELFPHLAGRFRQVEVRSR